MGDEPPPARRRPRPPPRPEAPAFAPELPDEFISIGAEVGYESSAQGPLQPGEERVVGLAGVPGEATSALVLITTREATKRGKVRIGSPDKDPEATFRFPKRGVRSAVMVVPVVGSQVKFVDVQEGRGAAARRGPRLRAQRQADQGAQRRRHPDRQGEARCG